MVPIENAPLSVAQFEVRPAEPEVCASEPVGSQLVDSSSGSEEESNEQPVVSNTLNTPRQADPESNASPGDCPPAPKRQRPSRSDRKRKRQRLLEKLLSVITDDGSTTESD